MSHALVHNGCVVEIAAATFPVHAGLSWVTVPDGLVVAVGWTWNGSQFAGPSTAATEDDVAAERTRRLSLGFDYVFPDARGTHRIVTTKTDMEGWSEVSTLAGALLDSGDITTQITIFTNTGPTQVTAPEWRAIEIAAAAFRQPLWTASFVLMNQNPIPADYANDQHWS